MTREEAKNWLNKLIIRSDITDEYGDMEDMQPYEEAVNMAIQALEQEPSEDMTIAYLMGLYADKKPCEDAISRQAVETLVDELARAISDERCCVSRGRSTATIMQDILDLPSVNPQEPKTGHWIEHPEIKTSIPEYLMFYECSECGDKQCFYKSDINKKHFCNNCGAKMREVKECNTCKHQLKFMCSEWKECKDKSKYEPQESEE